MTTLTAKMVKRYFKINNLELRHNHKALTKATNAVALRYSFDAYDIFMLVIENRPIDSAHTHSYGFQTSNGREIINRFSIEYKKALK